MFNSGELRKLAKVIAHSIHNTPYQYQPKRSKITYPIAKGWSNRFENYYWSSDTEPLSDWEYTLDLTNRLGKYAQSLVALNKVDQHIQASTVSDVVDLFKWGGVLKGKNHNPPPIQIINQVIRSAASYNINTDAPMDSAWTKLAAFSTAWLESNTERPPHIIYDSRVSVALLERIDEATLIDSDLSILKTRMIFSGLGYIPGQGGNRLKRVELLKQKKWRNGYKSWSSQFISSKLVDAIVYELNHNSSYNKMIYKNKSFDWSPRGVEMVLFMEGY